MQRHVKTGITREDLQVDNQRKHGKPALKQSKTSQDECQAVAQTRDAPALKQGKVRQGARRTLRTHCSYEGAGVAGGVGDNADVNHHRPVRREGLRGLVDAVRLAALAALAEAMLPTGGRETSRGVVERPRPDQPSRDSPQELSFFDPTSKLPFATTSTGKPGTRGSSGGGILVTSLVGYVLLNG